MLSMLNGILITVSLTMIFKLQTGNNIIQICGIFIVFFALQLIIFCIICSSREKEYKKKFPKPITKKEGGIKK